MHSVQFLPFHRRELFFHLKAKTRLLKASEFFQSFIADGPELPKGQREQFLFNREDCQDHDF